MLKKGGIFLSLVFMATFAVAQDKTAEMFRVDNPNLINLNETTEYTGAPLVYIEGVKAPEKAGNDMEELQLKFFGTKDIQNATKNTLELSNDLPATPENQIQNYTFETPFHQTIQSGFIPHVSNFMTIIQVLNQKQIMVSENVVVLNTTEDNVWSRNITLPAKATALVTDYVQNGQSYPLPALTQKDHLTFTAQEPLQLGPNHLVFKYTIDNPFQNGLLALNLIDEKSPWPVEQLKTLVLFPTTVQLTDGKLLFGSNKLDIPDIYNGIIDAESNLNLSVNRVVPPRAAVELQLQFDTSVLPPADTTNTESWLLYGSATILILYWLLFAWWEKHRLRRPYLPKIKYPRTLCGLAYQMGTFVNDQKWQRLIEFGQKNSWPIAKLLMEQQTMKVYPNKTKWQSASNTFWSLMTEPIIGTILLLVGVTIAAKMLHQSLPLYFLAGLVVLSILGLFLLYTLALKPTRRLYWKKKLDQLSQQPVLAGLTAQLVRQIYPLFILTQKQSEWRKNLATMNPKVAQETHLYKEKE